MLRNTAASFAATPHYLNTKTGSSLWHFGSVISAFDAYMLWTYYFLYICVCKYIYILVLFQ